MKKYKLFFRLIALLMLIALLPGCAGIYEGDYEVVSDHVEEDKGTSDDSSVREISSYASLKNALKDFIDKGAEEGIIRAVEYPGSIENDFSKASVELKREYPMAAYAVDYFMYVPTYVLSYTELAVSITYLLSKEEMDSIITVKSTYDFNDYLDKALNNYSERMVIQIINLSINDKSIRDYVKQYYLENPGLMIEEPSVTISFYPSADNVMKIISIQFSYNSSAELLVKRKSELTPAAAKLVDKIERSDSDAKTALSCVSTLISAVDFKRIGDTAYNAIVEGGANSEGYAMALKLLCKQLGIDCRVVEGRKNSEVYYWNIIELEGEFYHVDAYACDRYGMEAGFLKKDSEMSADSCWWNIDRYEECNGSLSYSQLIAETAEIEETEEETVSETVE